MYQLLVSNAKEYLMMRSSLLFIFCALVCNAVFISADISFTRLSKKDKGYIDEKFTELERTLINLQDVANNIQNSFVSVNVGQGSEQLKDIQAKLVIIQHQLVALYHLQSSLKQVLGNLDDASVGSEKFSDINDIDNAQLSIISLLKSIFRRQLEDDLIIS